MVGDKSQNDPLRANGSRVEETKGPWKRFQDLPAWYHRLLPKVIEHDMKSTHDYLYPADDNPVHDSDFYEDLSELDSDGTDMEVDEEDKEEEEDVGTSESTSESQVQDRRSYNGMGSEGHCLEEDADEDEDEEDDGDYNDFGSEQSYDGSDAGLYYQLKEQRDELKQSRKDEWAKKKEQCRWELEKENEVRVAYKAFKKDRKKGIQFPLNVHKTSRSYQLYCVDHTKHVWDPLPVTKRLDINVCDGHKLKTMSAEDDAEFLGQIYGQIYIASGSNCSFGPFDPPRFATRKTYTYEAEEQYDVLIRFVGERYVKVMLPQETVFGVVSQPVPDSAPEVFTYYGILIEFEKRILERKAAMDRHPSPGETFFEMSHPMGWWRQSYY
ncbi:hypothetical protein VM1G_06859 [Cytospora mali]|uniref:Uncharacterized protein n=1 Tax=Cytospora mali TaxID=578113 RepID=A0A194W576_CYTMA|nr:hypothetical protein VM1G_06859 [Valsa mali]